MDDISVVTQHFDNLLHESPDQAESPSTSHDAQPLQYDEIARDRSIRVLDLAPGTWDEPVNCSLRTVHLDDDDPRYEAISYAWGDYNDRKPIVCNGHAITTTRSLFEALQRFRYVDTTRTLWADSLCINQADDDEKTSQVRLMSCIYTRALRVLVWLQHDNDQVVQDSLNAICRFVCEEDGFGKFGALDTKPRPTPSILYRWRDMDVTCVSIVESSDVVHVASAALQLICRSLWFGRGWVVQEVALSTSASVFWGNSEIGFEWLGIASYCINSKYAYKLSTELMHCVFLFWVCRSSRRSDGPRQSFLDLVFTTSHLAFNEPKDRIYGLLGVRTLENDLTGGHSIVDPDYSISTMDCYRTVAAKLLCEEHDFRVLSWGRCASKPSEDWPSWVPDWNGNTFNTFSDFSVQFTEEKDTSGLVQISETVFGDTWCIEISGFRVDTINREVEEYVTVLSYEDEVNLFQGLRALLCRLEHVYSQQYLACIFGNGRRSQPLNSIRIANLLHEYHAFKERDFVQDTFSPKAALSDGKWWDDCLDSYVPSADRFALRCLSQKHGRSLFITSTDMLGFGPQAMIPGDVVVVFHGSTIPFVLRPVDNGLWQLVGGCYLYEVNEGRFHREWEEKGSVSGKFTIC